MSFCKHQNSETRTKKKQQQEPFRNDKQFMEQVRWFAPPGKLFDKSEFHGNVKWAAEELVTQSLIWAWQETKNVTNAFEKSRDICDDLKLPGTVRNFTSFMNALTRNRELFHNRLRERFQTLAEEVGGERFRTKGWVLIGFDGSRVTAPRSESNEQAFCAPNYGNGPKAKYGKKKSKGMRRKRNKDNPPQPQKPQAWLTMMWHMSLQLPWSWRLGPSNSSELEHVRDMLTLEKFPEKTLFCGDAGFVGYPLWSTIMSVAKQHFLVRVGANVDLLSETADVRQCGGQVLCWPKGRMNSGDPPLRLRLVNLTIGKTPMWFVTNVLNKRELSDKRIQEFYKMRWGVEVAFRGLKQTLDKCTLKCRNSDRLLAELDWAIRAMAVAELIALREQMRKGSANRRGSRKDPQRRSLAKTMRALRKCMSRLHKVPAADAGLLRALSDAVVQRYNNRTDKRSRYRPRNPDKKPLGDPNVTKLSAEQLRKLRQHQQHAQA